MLDAAGMEVCEAIRHLGGDLHHERCAQLAFLLAAGLGIDQAAEVAVAELEQQQEHFGNGSSERGGGPSSASIAEMGREREAEKAKDARIQALERHVEHLQRLVPRHPERGAKRGGGQTLSELIAAAGPSPAEQERVAVMEARVGGAMGTMSRLSRK